MVHKLKGEKNTESRQNTQDYLNRKSRGENRTVFNEQIARVPGLYNAQAKVDIVPLQTVDPYDFFNLNAVERTNCLNAHFQIIKERLRKQLNIDQFDEFGLPVHDEIQRICGRVCNMSTEDDKLKVDSIGLFNVGDDMGGKTYKLRLNMSDCKAFSLFEGEIVVAEGYNDSNSRFNVSRIYKPHTPAPAATEWPLLQKAQEQQQGKALHLMVVAGPYTTQTDLLYQPLRDLLDIAKRDKPHALVLMGPFLDAKSTQL